MHLIGSKLCDFDGRCPIDTFITYMEGLEMETQRIQAMDLVVKGVLERLSTTHYVNIEEWEHMVE